MKPSKNYYKVHGTRDGIVCIAFQTKKPRKSKGRPAPEIDDDGIWDWYVEGLEDANRFSAWGRGTHMVALTTYLNVRRIVRQIIEPRLDAIEQKLSGLESKLDRIIALMEAKEGSSD